MTSPVAGNYPGDEGVYESTNLRAAIARLFRLRVLTAHCRLPTAHCTLPAGRRPLFRPQPREDPARHEPVDQAVEQGLERGRPTPPIPDRVLRQRHAVGEQADEAAVVECKPWVSAGSDNLPHEQRGAGTHHEAVDEPE